MMKSLMKKKSVMKYPHCINVQSAVMNFKAISTFSGIGGSSYGYKLAGFDVVAAVEFLDYQSNNYRLNHANTLLLQQDIRTIDALELLQQLNIKQYELDLLDGSPPCSSFSTAGSL